ncbi:MAG: thioredoxin [Planctomycetaceae bacterium]|nr:thioredoxin [Planctomycetaceae bacterium]
MVRSLVCWATVLLLAAAAAGCAAGRGRTFADRRSNEKAGRAQLAASDYSRGGEQSSGRGAAANSYRAGGDWSTAKAPAPRSPSQPPNYVAPVSLSSEISASGPVEITSQNFEAVVLNSPVPVLVDCWAPWCGPCKKMGPAVDSLANEFEGRAVVAKMDIDACKEIAHRYQITNIPAFLYFRNGEVVDRVVGMTPKAQLGQRLAVMSADVQPAGGQQSE